MLLFQLTNLPILVVVQLVEVMFAATLVGYPNGGHCLNELVKVQRQIALQSAVKEC